MPRKSKPKDGGGAETPDRMVQISFRDFASNRERLVRVAAALGVNDPSTVLRMMVKEFLPILEHRAREIVEREQQSKDAGDR